MMKRLFKGGTVVSGEGLKKIDLLVKGEKILAAGKNLEFQDAETIDVRGKLLFPGFIDAHTHMAAKFNDITAADKFETGTKAALAGGTTCIIDFAEQKKGKSLKEGRIQTIASDHFGFTKEQKNAGEEDFMLTPSGMPGAEERPALMWQFGVNEGKITAEQMCAYLSENPAKLFKLYPWKGALIPGSDADIVIWNPNTEWTMTAADHQSACDYCLLEGAEIEGRAEQVYLRGKLVAENGKIIEEKTGMYIRHGVE